jgi:hypothetical protein
MRDEAIHADESRLARFPVVQRKFRRSVHSSPSSIARRGRHLQIEIGGLQSSEGGATRMIVTDSNGRTNQVAFASSRRTSLMTRTHTVHPDPFFH